MFIVIKTLDQNSNVSFLRNEFSKIYRHDFWTHEFFATALGLKSETHFQAKYEHLQYMPKDEDNSEDQYDLNAQLYAAARTNELLTSLRLLAQGFIFC